ncbi:MAG TPA: ABC transporter permease [Candidatus Acidoferrales bacterium]|nr:ABC transporter permease [Candidatus Acidoferrales bacterium]
MRWFGRRDRDYREELETHIQMEARENLDRGMPPGEARQAALRTFGNALAVREGLADERPLHFWETLYRDLRYGARLLQRSPGLTATIVLTLALGIGANAAVFSLVEAVLLRMLPVRDPHSLVIVRALTRQGARDWFSHKDYEWLRDHNHAFSGLAATANWRLTLDSGDHNERIGVEFVSGNYFSMLGVEPAVGRMIAMEDDRQNRPVAVISYGYWQRAFGGGANALGRQLHLEKTALEIIGVAPRGFQGEYDGDPPDFWLPLAAQPVISPRRSFLNTRNASWLGIMGRLRPGLSAPQAQAGMGPLLESLRADLQVDSQNDYLGAIGIEPGGGGLSHLRDYYAEPLRVLMALVAVVLLIACANVANLLLARSSARRREFAVRLAIGAGRARLVRQLLTESFLLSAMACAAGLAIARGLVRLLLAMPDTKGLDVHMNLAVLAFTVTISLAAAVAFGLAPAMQGNRVDTWTALKDGKMAAGPGHRFSSARVLIVTETALSMVLLVASGLLLRTFLNLKAVSPGFDEQALQANLDTSLVAENGVALGRKLTERLATLPGVQTVSFSRFGFGQGSDRVCCIAPEGYTPVADEDKNVRTQAVSSGYFRALGIPILAGREFAATDRYGAGRVAVVNEAVARHYFRGANPVGKRFAWWPTDPKNIEIIGVVKDAKYDNLRQQTPRLVYLSILQEGPGPNFVQIRGLPGGRSLAAVIGDCRAAIRGVNANIRIVSFQPLTAAVSRTMAPDRLVSWLSAGFGMVALLLTAVGLYGILAYTVARRTSEFGIRMALGAGRMAILRMVMKEGLLLVGIGLVAGLAVAVSFSHLVASLLFGVQPHDIVTFAAAAMTLIIVAIAASYGPARRATAVEPVTALRYE